MAEQKCNIMKAFSGPNASVYSNFGYGFGVNQPTTPITATMQNIQNSSHEMLSSGFISGQMTSGSASVSTFNNYCGTQQIDVLKKRPFEDLIDESSDDNEYAQDFENEAMAEAPSSLAYSNSWCSSELRSKCRENSFKLSFDISDSKCLNLDLGSDVSDLSDCENIIEHSEFNPDRASTPNNDQNGNEESNPTSDMQYDNEPGAEWPTKDDNELFCEYCKKQGKHPMVVKSHTMKDKKDRVLCPSLRLVECIICGADGDNAHMVTDCPDLENLMDSETQN